MTWSWNTERLFSFYSPPWCISSHPEGDWPSTLAPSAAAAGLSPSAAQHRTLWAHGAAARSLAPHWSGLGGAARETGSHRSGFRPLRQTFTNTELQSLADVYTSGRTRSDAHPYMHVDWMRRFLHRVLGAAGWYRAVKKGCRVHRWCRVSETQYMNSCQFCLLYLLSACEKRCPAAEAQSATLVTKTK